MVVGVARDSRWRSIEGEQDPFLYQPFGHFYRVASSVYMIKSKLPSQHVGEIAKLFGVSPLEPLVYVAAVSTLAAVVALACVGPTWRAIRVPAVVVLRAE